MPSSAQLEDTESYESQSSSSNSSSSSTSLHESDDSESSISTSTSKFAAQTRPAVARKQSSKWLQRERLFQKFCSSHILLPTPSQIIRTGKSRGYSLRIASIQNLVIPNKLVERLSSTHDSSPTKVTDESIWTVGIHVSMFHNSCLFFGNTWVSPEIVVNPNEFQERKSRSTHICSIVIPSIHINCKSFCISDIKDSNCFAIFELVLYERDATTKTAMAASGCGWTAVPLFASAHRNSYEKNQSDPAYQSAEVFAKSPRVLWELCSTSNDIRTAKQPISWHQLNRIEDCKIYYEFEECHDLGFTKFQTLLRNNEFVGALDVVPGFKNHNLAHIDLSRHPDLSVWREIKSGGKHSCDNCTYQQALKIYRCLSSKLPECIELGPSYELTVIAKRVCIHLRQEMEKNLIERLRLSRLADANTKFAGASEIKGDISARTLKVALHNGRRLRTQWSSIPLKVDHANGESADTLICLANASKMKGFVLHPYMALIVMVQYTVHFRITWSEKKKQQLSKSQVHEVHASGERNIFPEQDVVSVTLGVRAALPSDGKKLYLYDEAATPWVIAGHKKEKERSTLRLDLLTGSSCRNFTDTPLFIPPNCTKSAVSSQDPLQCSQVVGAVELRIIPPIHRRTIEAKKSSPIKSSEPASKDMASECQLLKTGEHDEATKLPVTATDNSDLPHCTHPAARDNVRHLSRAARTAVLKRCPNIRNDAEKSVSMIKCLTTEIQDPLTNHDICFQFAYIRYPCDLSLSSRQEIPHHVFFTFQFYRFPPTRTDEIRLQPVNDTMEAQNDTWQSYKIISVGGDTNSERAFVIQFQVDTTIRKDPFEVRDFALYLMHKDLNIDVWNAHSGFHAGSFAVPLHYLLRQGSAMSKQMIEIDIMEPLTHLVYYDAVGVKAELDKALHIQNTKSGSYEDRVGVVQLLMTNFGSKGVHSFDDSIRLGSTLQDHWKEVKPIRSCTTKKRRIFARPAAQRDPNLRKALVNAGLHTVASNLNGAQRRVSTAVLAARRRVMERNQSMKQDNPTRYVTKEDLQLLCERYRASETTTEAFSESLTPIYCDLKGMSGFAALLRVDPIVQPFEDPSHTMSPECGIADCKQILPENALSLLRRRASEIHKNDPEALYEAIATGGSEISMEHVNKALQPFFQDQMDDFKALVNSLKAQSFPTEMERLAALWNLLDLPLDTKILRQCRKNSLNKLVMKSLLIAHQKNIDIVEDAFHREDANVKGLLDSKKSVEALMNILSSQSCNTIASQTDRDMVSQYVFENSGGAVTLNCDQFHALCGFDASLHLCGRLTKVLGIIKLEATQSREELSRPLSKSTLRDTLVKELRKKVSNHSTDLGLYLDTLIENQKINLLIDWIGKSQLSSQILGEKRDDQSLEKMWLQMEEAFMATIENAEQESSGIVPFTKVKEVLSKNSNSTVNAFDANLVYQWFVYFGILHAKDDNVSLLILKLLLFDKKTPTASEIQSQKQAVDPHLLEEDKEMSSIEHSESSNRTGDTEKRKSDIDKSGHRTQPQESYTFHSDPKIRSIEMRIRNAAMDAYKRRENPLTLLHKFHQHRSAFSVQDSILLRVELEQFLQELGFAIESDIEDDVGLEDSAEGSIAPDTMKANNATASAPRFRDPLYARQLDRLTRYNEHLRHTKETDKTFTNSCGNQKAPLSNMKSGVSKQLSDLRSFSRQKSAFLRVLTQYRNGQKKSFIYALVKDHVTNSLTLFPSYGSLLFLEIPFRNSYVHAERFQIQIQLMKDQDEISHPADFDVQVVRDAEEWKFLRSHTPPVNMPWTAWKSDFYDALPDIVEKEMIDNENELIVEAHEELHIPIRLRWLTEKQREGRVSIIFKSCTQRHIMMTYHLQLHPKPFICNRFLRFQHAPSEIWRSAFIIPSGKAVICMDPHVSTEVIATSEHAKRQKLCLQCRIGAYPSNRSFHVILYSDAFCAQIYEIWNVHIQTTQQMHVHTVLGQRTAIELPVQSNKRTQREQRIRCFLPPRMQHLIRFAQPEIHKLQSDIPTRIQCHYSCWNWSQVTTISSATAQLYQILLIHVVDIDTLEIMDVWQLHVYISSPRVTKQYNLSIITNGASSNNDVSTPRMVQKKIAYRNPWQYEQDFIVRSSNTAYLIPRDKLVHAPACAVIFLRMLFPTAWPENGHHNSNEEKLWPASAVVYLFMMNHETLQQEECLCFQISYNVPNDTEHSTHI